MIYGSVCSGIEAASVAWHPLGWRAAFLSEIEAFPRAVLKQRWPDVPLHGDFTTIRQGEYADIDVLVGGTPCQSFSVAGLRKGLDDERGNLALEFLRLAARLGPKWVVWENVPGVLSSNGGRDFGAFLGALAELGYGWAYRVLDAQYIRVDGYARAVPQRRRRVFVVGHLGDWRRAAAVLFEREGMRGDSAPRREAGKTAPTIPSRSTAGGGLSTDFDCDGGLVAGTLGSHTGIEAQQAWTGRMVPVATFPRERARARHLDVCRHAGRAHEDGTGRGTPLVVSGGSFPSITDLPTLTCRRGDQTAIAFTCKDHGADAGDIAPTLRGMGHDASHANGGGQVAVAFNWQNGGGYGDAHDGLGISEEHAPPHSRSQVAAVATHMAVRRLTPRECERLQGFSDDYTLITRKGKPAADGPRYKALGNSMAIPPMRWIGRRIAMVEAIIAALDGAA